LSQDGRLNVDSFVDSSSVPTSVKFHNFPVYTNRQSIARFLALYELYKLQANVKGSIVEGGVFQGGGTFTWASLIQIFEPSNYHRQVIGFDTFDGFPTWMNLDQSGVDNVGKFKPEYDSYAELQNAISAHQTNQYIDSKKQIHLIKGNAVETMKGFITANPFFLCSLLYLDFDIYEPTRVAIETFLPRMPKGAVIAFDEIHNPNWAGETQALLDTLGVRDLQLKSFSFEPHVSYAVI